MKPITYEQLNKMWLEYHDIPRVCREERFGQWVFNRYGEEGESWPELSYAKNTDAYRILERVCS